MANFIKQIKAKNASGQEVAYDIDAKKWDGHSFSEITNLVHGVVDTYVIPAQTGTSATSDYKAIVESSAAQVKTTTAKLGTLTGTPAASWDKFEVGDIVLMGATSDGKVNFDRWISKVDASGNVTLDVLETQVATHHHTLPVVSVSRTISSSKALTSATPTYTTANVVKVGTAVDNVITGASGDVITNVTYDGSGSHSLDIVTGTSTDYGHKHTVNGHTHSVSFKPSTFVSKTLEAYYSLTSVNHTPHTHTNTTVVGTTTNASAFTYATGEASATATFIKTLKDSSSTTGSNTAALATGANTAALTTSAQASTDTIGSDVLTVTAGAHTHSLSASTESAVKTVTLQGTVITSVNHSYTAPIVQANVVTSVTKVQKTAVTSAKLTGTKTFVNTATVDGNGILSFGTATVGIDAPTTIISGINSITGGTQSAGSASFSFTSGSQTHTSGKLTVSGSATSAGAHQHGFSHTHAIPSHTHTIPSHTHTYNKSVSDGTGSAITSLKTASHTPHTHTNAIVAGAHSNGSVIKIVNGGSTSAVVKELKNTDQTFTTTSTAPDTSTVYAKVSGTITQPGLTLTKRTFGNKSITPAVDSGEKAIKSISYGSSNFLTGVTITATSGKSGKNIGGE